MATELLNLQLAFRALSDEDASDEEGVTPDSGDLEDDDELEDGDMAKPDTDDGDDEGEKIEE
jgi:hypothetical protein